MSVYQRFMEPDFQNTWFEVMSWQWSDFDDFQAKYSEKANPEAWNKILWVATFFEGLGVLVKRGFIDTAIVDDLMSMYVIGFWQKIEPLWIRLRKLWNSPAAGEHVEYLYGVIHEIWKQQHPGLGDPTLPQ
jgi:hypothetical protein